MTLLELSVEYRDHARALDFRIVQLRDAWEHTMDEGERCMLAERIRVLSTMLREARESRRVAGASGTRAENS